ncbi:Ankyrin repeat protein [Rickettsiales bacterium Ac37b]|nr:Ankyrin repeat protein [Rickettsiales bacterium Ac37b]
MKNSGIKLSNVGEIVKICNKYTEIDTKNFLNLMEDNHYSSRKKMHEAAKCGDLKKIQYLRSKGVSAEIKDEQGKTILHISIIYNKKEIVEYLCEQGVEKNVQDNNGMTPLHHAVTKSNLDIVKVLLPNVDKVAKESIEAKDQIQDLQIKYINTTDHEKKTALHYALSLKNIKIIQFMKRRQLCIMLFL